MREALEKTDLEDLKTKVTALQNASMAIGKAVYSSAKADAPPPPAEEATKADGEEKKEEKK